MPTSRIQVTHHGELFNWTGKQWTDASGEIAPIGVRVELNSYIIDVLEAEDAEVMEFSEFISRARDARKSCQWRRAEHLSRKALGMRPGDAGALASLCASIREMKRPQEALDASANYQGKPTQALLTARAAAMCDLCRWEEAKSEVGKALALGRNSYSFAVVKRIKVVRPDLYEKELSGDQGEGSLTDKRRRFPRSRPVLAVSKLTDDTNSARVHSQRPGWLSPSEKDAKYNLKYGLPRRTGAVWSAAEEEDLRQMWRENVPVEEIAKQLERGRKAVEPRLRRLGLL